MVTVLRIADSSAAVVFLSVSVAIQECGAAAKVLGENTMTKLMPMVSHFTVRKLAIFAVTFRPRMLTVIVSPSLRPSSLPSCAVKEAERLLGIVEFHRALRQGGVVRDGG